jgi:CubicO group peptidase (beta-lactamase class C family)
MKKIFILLLLITCPALMALPQSSDYPSSESIASALQPYINRGEIAGIITIVAKKENILSLDCVGYQNIRTKQTMSPESLFWIASQSKPITAVAVMMLVEEGKLSLDQPVTTWLPELKSLKVSGKPITLRHLLSHTGGMKFKNVIQEKMKYIDVLPLQAGVAASSFSPLEFEPGEGYRYSNQGFNTAAAIVERVSGMPFEEFLQKRLFEPLGMTSTTFLPAEEQLERLAVSYKKGEDGKLVETRIDQLQYPLQDGRKRFPEAGGGLFSTAADLVRFYQMIAAGGMYNGTRFISEASIAEMGTRQTKDEEKPYGLGWHLGPDHINHGGSYGTNSRIYVSDGFVVMYLVQAAGIPETEDAYAAFLSIAKKQFR